MDSKTDGVPGLVRFSRFVTVFILLVIVASASLNAGTKVLFSTSIGDIVIELYDDEKPITVANFLRYLQAGRYADTFVHRLVPGFVVQGGGYSVVEVNSNYETQKVLTFDPIVNEFSSGPKLSNAYGTIAMAKIPATDGMGVPIPGGGPDSATSQWFINLADNSSNLDYQNGGFTVFGRVVDGLDVLGLFNTAFPLFPTSGIGVYDESATYGSAFTRLPLLPGAGDAKYVVFTDISLVPEPAIVPLSGKRIVTVRRAIRLSGLLEGDVAKIEWRVGRIGNWKKRKARNEKWRIRIRGLEEGRNLVFLRGVTSDGDRTKASKLRVIRK